ncbi:hypothetical protein RFI_16618, partial [Reticulomyxa filosa]
NNNNNNNNNNDKKKKKNLVEHLDMNDIDNDEDNDNNDNGFDGGRGVSTVAMEVETFQRVFRGYKKGALVSYLCTIWMIILMCSAVSIVVFRLRETDASVPDSYQTLRCVIIPMIVLLTDVAALLVIRQGVLRDLDIQVFFNSFFFFFFLKRFDFIERQYVHDNIYIYIYLYACC